MLILIQAGWLSAGWSSWCPTSSTPPWGRGRTSPRPPPSLLTSPTPRIVFPKYLSIIISPGRPAERTTSLNNMKSETRTKCRLHRWDQMRSWGPPKVIGFIGDPCSMNTSFCLSCNSLLIFFDYIINRLRKGSTNQKPTDHNFGKPNPGCFGHMWLLKFLTCVTEVF